MRRQSVPAYWLIRLLRTRGSGATRRPGALPPDPWHLALSANSMAVEDGRQPTASGWIRAWLSESGRPLGHRKRGGFSLSYHAIGPTRQMPGVWGLVPKGRGSVQKPDMLPEATMRVKANFRVQAGSPVCSTSLDARWHAPGVPRSPRPETLRLGLPNAMNRVWGPPLPPVGVQPAGGSGPRKRGTPNR